jgi:hypothetical protein
MNIETEAEKLAIDFDEWALECEKSGGNLNLSADEQRYIANTLRKVNAISKEDRDKLLQKLRDRKAYRK